MKAKTSGNIGVCCNNDACGALKYPWRLLGGSRLPGNSLGTLKTFLEALGESFGEPRRALKGKRCRCKPYGTFGQPWEASGKLQRTSSSQKDLGSFENLGEVLASFGISRFGGFGKFIMMLQSAAEMPTILTKPTPWEIAGNLGKSRLATASLGSCWGKNLGLPNWGQEVCWLVYLGRPAPQ